MQPDQPLRPGGHLGRYELVALLGAGGMGEVWRARDPRLEREIALKVLPADVSRDAARLSRFEREAKALAALNHPNIVTIHSVEEADGIRFLTTELVEGKTLDRLISPGGMPLDRLFSIAVPLADAVAAAHARGILHRDLKPGNVMVADDGRVKVLDFGLAKLAAREVTPDTEAATAERRDLTSEGQILGTVPYMSPEQIEGRAVDARCDLFSLGVILYEMGTGRRPFRGGSTAEVISSILRDEPTPPGDWRPDLPHDVERIVRHCLVKDPERRFQSAKDLRNELDELRTELSYPKAARTAELATPQRRPWRVVSAGAGVIGLAVIAVLALTLGRGGQPAANAPAAPQITSLAVLPLKNLMGDPGQDYFVEGMHEALTAELSRIGALKVISRTSAMSFRDSNMTMPDIARALGVDALIEGSVLREADRVRITVQLIHGPTDRHLWADSYERELRGILRLQSDVARAIANEMRLTLSPAEKAQLARARVVDPEAYEHFLRGQYHWNKYNADGWVESIAHFRESIEKDPSYAPPHAMMSFAHTLLGYYRSLTPPPLLHEQALEAAEAAIALDGSLAEAHASLAMVKTAFEWDWNAADRASEEALRLNSNSQMALYARAFFLSLVGRHEEAIAVARRAVDLDPVAPHMSNSLGMFYFMARRYDEAIDQMKRVFILEPDFIDAHLWSAYSYAKKGMYDEAHSAWRTVKQLSGRPTEVNWGDAWILALDGRREEAREVLRTSRHLYAGYPGRAYFRAIGYGQLGDTDRAFELLEDSYRGRSPYMSILKVDPRIDGLRSDPRFDDLLHRLKFP